MMLTLKMLILGIIFIISGGAVFGRVFRNNFIVEFLAGVIASTAFVFLTIDIIKAHFIQEPGPIPELPPIPMPQPEPIPPPSETLVPPTEPGESPVDIPPTKLELPKGLPLTRNGEVNFEKVFRPVRDEFEKKEEFTARRQTLLQLFNQAVIQHDSRVQAGVVHLEKQNYDVDKGIFKVRIELSNWAKTMIAPSGMITVKRDEAKALYERGQTKPLFIVLQEGVTPKRIFLVGLGREIEVEKVQYHPGDAFQHRLKDGSLGPEMVIIPKGSFRMGDIQGDGQDDEKPVHRVTFDYTFAMSKYEVTVGDFKQFVQATSYSSKVGAEWSCKGFMQPNFSQTDAHPVACVTWHDAKAYAKWLSEQTGYEYRLPSEAEWEYAARAGTETKYWWGNEGSHEYMNFRGQSGKDQWEYTALVGSFPANPFGLHDMNGNVWEWNEDNWHSNYNGAPTDGSVWKDNKENRLLLRGGSWINAANVCRSAGRVRYYLVDRSNDGGVRLVVLFP